MAVDALPSPVLTPLEACRYLRLDAGREDDHEAQIRALNRLVDQKKQIRPLMYRTSRLYHRDELDRFLETQLK